MDDGNPEWSDAEKQQLQVAYTFGSFWAGSTDGMRARAEMKFTDQGVEKTCLNDSFPLVTGDEFDKQMDIWYSTITHQRFADKEKMPGFQKVLELWQKGQLWDISDKAYPYYIQEDGAQKAAAYEWLNIYNKDVAGALRTDANWLDQVKSKLPDWNKVINERYNTADQQLRDGLKEFYGYTDDSFTKK